MKSSIKFSNADASFSKSLRHKVNVYFTANGKSRTGDWRIFLKAVILLMSMVVLYTLLLVIQPYWLISILLCIILGVNIAAIGFNIMHDAGHNSFAKRTGVNNFFSYTLNLVGGNIYLWKLKHNIAHHTYTNIEGEDHDIEIKFMRIHHDQELKKHHKFQRFYFVFLYGISYLAWVFFQDYEKYFRQKLGKKSEKFKLPLKEKVIFWTSKIVHLCLFVVIPIITVGLGPALLGLLITGGACGICLAVVFQLAHVVEGVELATVSEGLIEDEWMVHQLKSTANFAIGDRVLTWLLGGLNFQVEHHLFPRISHVHYPAINKIVKETCEEFEVKYVEFKTFGGAFKSHLLAIQRMSI
ncbi:fatty acid desaturase family protein [Sphingobacterium tabacisoli]|uniref:Fatty acid desaturase family protein n=1 Tax=Sphingobacterium tabacisoli TaxID=2044855 RepID=A0ABW5L5B7_9SPHI|nr:acyl-CoA desaturase [Sphingobacterium tabacisoli]